MSDAFRVAEQFFHEPSKTYIYFCKGLSHLGAKGVGAFPNESYDNFQHNLKKMVEPATDFQLSNWGKILQSEVKRADMELRLKYLSEDSLESKPKKQVKVRVADEFKGLYKKLEGTKAKKRMFMIQYIEIVNALWKQIPTGHYNVPGSDEELTILLKVTKVRPKSIKKRISISLPNETDLKGKLIAEELNVKYSPLRDTLANIAVKRAEAA